MELTEQEIERMVMEASRAEYLAGESRRAHNLWQEETSTSAGAEPSSSRASKLRFIFPLAVQPYKKPIHGMLGCFSPVINHDAISIRND